MARIVEPLRSVHYLPFLERDGSRTAVPSGVVLAESGGTVDYAAGPDGGGVQITRTAGRYLACADTTQFSPGDSDFTFLVPVWLDSIPTSDTVVLAKSATAAGAREFQLYRRNSNNRWTFLVSSTGSNSVLVDDSVTVAVTGAWVWLACYHDSVKNTINLQINNGTVRTVSHTLGLFQSTLRFCVGNLDGATTLFDGKIGPIRYFNRLLSASEKTWWYNGGAGRPQFRTARSSTIRHPLNPSLWLTRDSTSGKDLITDQAFTTVGTPQMVAGLLGTGVDFTRANGDYLRGGDWAGAEPSQTAGFGGLMWAYPRASANLQYLVAKWDNDASCEWYIARLATGEISLGVSYDGTAAHAVGNSSSPVADATPTHVAWWWDPIRASIYLQLDHGAINAVSAPGGFYNGTANLVVGARSDGAGGFEGRVDDLVLFQRPPTQSEVAWHYNAGAGRTPNQWRTAVSTPRTAVS